MNTMNSSNYIIIFNNKIDIGDVFALIFVVIILILPIIKLLPHLKLHKDTYKHTFSQGFVPSAILTIISHIIFIIFPQHTIFAKISSMIASLILFITAIKIKAFSIVYNLDNADNDDLEKVNKTSKDTRKIVYYYQYSKASSLILLGINLVIVFYF